MSNSEENVSAAAVVRLAEISDADGITRLINSAFRVAEEFFVAGDRIAITEVRALLSQGKFLLAENAGEVAACVYIEPRGDRAYLGLLSVDPQRQQFGLGSSLMQAAEDHCRSLGCRFMDINVVNLRKELFGFYARRGYVETGSSPFPEDVATKLPCHFVEMSKLL